MSPSGASDAGDLQRVNERLIALYDHAIHKTLRWLRVCGVAFVASVLLLWLAVPSLPPEVGQWVFTMSAAVGGFAAASLVVLGIVLVIWATKKKAAVDLRAELDARRNP